MPHFLRSLSAAALIAVGGIASAQTTTEPATPSTDTATPAPEAPAQTGDQAAAPAGGTQPPAQPGAPADLDMGTEVGAENAEGPGSTYVQEEHGDWQVRCIRAGEGQKDPCQLYQLLQDEQGNPVAEISMFALPEGQQAAAGATVITPLETLLTQQLTLAVDGGATKRYPYTFCTPTGCFARIGFTNADVAAFKAGAKATVTLVPAAAPDQKVNLTVSLSGFTAGFEAVKKINAEAN
ncbi:invasion associated locus B family protein [Oceaniglobus roseus]|uniref:invasion associated locus B family protein n=1 Tax=Oceaniglobus roseus TaxID=1737570 RepID=UPI000C7F1623|nr:invasion associated locus B family protein [Kandeliimicrobium roseum]